jgi:hypothetical protein
MQTQKFTGINKVPCMAECFVSWPTQPSEPLTQRLSPTAKHSQASISKSASFARYGGQRSRQPHYEFSLGRPLLTTNVRSPETMVKRLLW